MREGRGERRGGGRGGEGGEEGRGDTDSDSVTVTVCTVPTCINHISYLIQVAYAHYNEYTCTNTPKHGMKTFITIVVMYLSAGAALVQFDLRVLL